MSVRTLETDFLVVGAGAMGMAFADEVLASDPQAEVVLIDRRARPGGHWNDAYSFVSLHQPAAYYGVNSLPLGRGGAALASGSEVLAYYERVLRRLTATGRLRFFPLCDFSGGDRFRSLVEPDDEVAVSVRNSVVDATYMNVEVPSTTPPRYQVAPDAALVPPNALPRLSAPHPEYYVLGGGKTAMDAVLFLLASGVEPRRVGWVMPNDAWLLDRAHIQPGRMSDTGAEVGSFVGASSLHEVFARLAAERRVLRLDEDVWPTKYRCATVSQGELSQLRRVENVVRCGRVLRAERGALELEQGRLSTDPEALYVDCTADGLARRDARPVFEPGRITLQSLFMCQQVFSAAVTGQIACRDLPLAEKNALCRVVPHPEYSRDYVRAFAMSLANMNGWAGALGRWLRRSRLSFLHHEPAFRLLVSGLRGRRLLSRAAPGFRNIFEQEFPDESFPL